MDDVIYWNTGAGGTSSHHWLRLRVERVQLSNVAADRAVVAGLDCAVIPELSSSSSRSKGALFGSNPPPEPVAGLKKQQ